MFAYLQYQKLGIIFFPFMTKKTDSKEPAFLNFTYVLGNVYRNI